MSRKPNIFNTINIRILVVLLVLFIMIAGVIGAVNTINIRNLYEESYTQRLLLSNALMGTLIRSEDIEYFVDLMRSQDDEFKARQVDFYYDRDELFRLQEAGASQEEQQALMDRLALFHAETREFKNDTYWETLDSLKELKEISQSTYVYVMADTGLKTLDGETLYTYIFDAEDEGEYNSPDMDGLGTSDTGNEAFTSVFTTKVQTEKAEHYTGDFGELYFVCVPLLNENGDVIAVLGTDLSLDDMNSAVSLSITLFNGIIIAVFIVSVLIIFTLLSRSIAKPLSSLTETATLFAEGNLHTTISESALKQRTEIGTLAHAFKSTLDATTLYLNSVPECLFIMSRTCETYFRNDQFIKRFGSLEARKFISALFPENASAELEKIYGQESGDVTVVWINGSCFAVMLKEIILQNMSENSILVIANDITDLMNEKENAQAAAAAKSSFLSRMSHEMRTPMNAIIGMAKIARGTDNLSKLKHCLSTIETSSEQLLGIINDVLDMSKIEAGKFELENVPMNLEKMLMKTCNLVIENMEKKNQKFNVVLAKDLCLNYIGDELRLSQVLTNLLSNAAKFTPENGRITLSVEQAGWQDDTVSLRFSIADSGIGMTEEQIARLFNSFEQADGSITRRFGGTGLGLAISKSIVEKMDGHVDVKSEFGSGSEFIFEVKLKRAPHQDTVIFDGIRPADITILIVENDQDIRKRILTITEGFGIKADTATSAEETFRLTELARQANRVYDIIFLDYDLPDANGLDTIKQLSGMIDKNTVIVVTSFSEWRRIEDSVKEVGVSRYIAKPIFPSAILDAINEVVGQSLKTLDIKTETQKEAPDFSGLHILLAEDVEINREIFFAVLEETRISIDTAENGHIAVSKYRENPDKYDMIIMDIQMPEMDGYEATRTIRALDIPGAKSIPIVAMTANAFKEDIDRCLACGMNDHLSKPIDEGAVIERIQRYTASVEA